MYLGRDMPAATTLCITQRDDPSPYKSSEEYTFDIIQAADEFVKIDHRPAPFYANTR